MRSISTISTISAGNLGAGEIGPDGGWWRGGCCGGARRGQTRESIIVGAAQVCCCAGRRRQRLGDGGGCHTDRGHASTLAQLSRQRVPSSARGRRVLLGRMREKAAQGKGRQTRATVTESSSCKQSRCRIAGRYRRAVALSVALSGALSMGNTDEDGDETPSKMEAPRVPPRENPSHFEQRGPGCGTGARLTFLQHIWFAEKASLVYSGTVHVTRIALPPPNRHGHCFSAQAPVVQS